MVNKIFHWSDEYFKIYTYQLLFFFFFVFNKLLKNRSIAVTLSNYNVFYSLFNNKHNNLHLLHNTGYKRGGGARPHLISLYIYFTFYNDLLVLFFSQSCADYFNQLINSFTWCCFFSTQFIFLLIFFSINLLDLYGTIVISIDFCIIFSKLHVRFDWNCWLI